MLDRAEETVGFIADPGSEEQGVTWARLATITKGQSPQAINRNGIAKLILWLTEEGTCLGIEGIDMAVTEIADQ